MKRKRISVVGPSSEFNTIQQLVLSDPEEVQVDSLTISNTDLTYIRAFPDGVEEINCENNSALTDLPELPDSLQYFSCNYNKLTSLPEQDEGELIKVECVGNLLTDLPLMPTVTSLDARDNKMKKFPNVAPGLRELYLSGNPFSKKMTELKRFAKYIRENNCDHDLDTMIDLKSYRALQLASKSGTFRNIPRELQNYMEEFIAGKRKTRKRHSKIERFRFSRFRLK